VVVVEFFRDRDGLLLHVHILPSVDQLPVSSDGVGDGGDGLLGKGQVSNFAIVLGNQDIAAVGEETEAIQQLLGNGDIQRRCNRGVEDVKRAGRTTSVVPRQAYRRARSKAL